MDVQALGVELITEVRCLSCGKVLAGRIENEYDRLMKLTLREVNEIVPRNLSPKERDELSLKFINIRTKEIFQILGIKRYCCMTNLQYKSQILVGAPSPAENSIIDRQNMTTKRSMTRIDLSLPSRVPGNSGFSMESLPGEEDYGPEWKAYKEKTRRDLSSPQNNYKANQTKLVLPKATLPIGFNIKNSNIPITKTGNSTIIKQQYLDMLVEPTFLTSTNEDEMVIETVSSLSQMKISDQQDINGINIKDEMDFEINNGENFNNGFF